MHTNPSCNTQLCELGHLTRKYTGALKHDQKCTESYVTAGAPWYVSLPVSFNVNKRGHTHIKQVTQLYGILGHKDHLAPGKRLDRCSSNLPQTTGRILERIV